MQSLKSLIILGLAAFGLCLTSTAQPVFTGRPAPVPLALGTTNFFTLAPQATNTYTPSTTGLIFPINLAHNVAFQYDVVSTNGVGTSNAVVVFDTAFDAIGEPGSWKTAYNTQLLSSFPSSSNSTTYTFVISNVPAFWMRVGQLGSAATNYLQISNFLYYPFL